MAHLKCKKHGRRILVVQPISSFTGVFRNVDIEGSRLTHEIFESTEFGHFGLSGKPIHRSDSSPCDSKRIAIAEAEFERVLV